MGQSGKAIPAPMLVTTPPQVKSNTVMTTVNAENRQRQVQSESEERENDTGLERFIKRRIGTASARTLERLCGLVQGSKSDRCSHERGRSQFRKEGTNGTIHTIFPTLCRLSFQSSRLAFSPTLTHPPTPH